MVLIRCRCIVNTVEGRQETKKNKIKKNLLEGDRFFASKKGKKNMVQSIFF